MIWIKNLLFFCLVMQWKCLNSLIFPPKLMLDGEHDQVHQKPPLIYIVKINNPPEDPSAEKMTNGGGLMVDPAKETNDENWDSKNRNRFQMWRINGQNNNKKIIFSRPLMWQSHRSFPSICMAGPSMFRSCCSRLRELSNDTESMPQFCFFGRCCSNLTSNVSTAPTPIPFHAPHPSLPIVLSVSNPSNVLSSEQQSPDAVSTQSLIENLSNETSSSQSSGTTKVPLSPQLLSKTALLTPESKKLRINEKKLNSNFKGGNKNSNENINFQSRTKVNILPENNEQSIFGEKDSEIEALAASATKLIKMSGKGKNFLSREDGTEKDEKSGSEEGSAEDSLRFDGDGSASEDIDDIKNKSETTRPPKTASSSVETNYSELEESVSGGDKSNEPLEIDDDVSKYSEESVEDISKHIKPYRKSQTKQKTETTKKNPIVTPKPKNITAETKSLGTTNITTNPLTDTTLITKDQATTVSTTKDNRLSPTKSLNLAVTASTLLTTKAKTDSSSSVKTESKEVKNICPRNKGGPNCTIDITGAITGYGYYVYLHHRPLSRADSVRECATRNMSLAFLTNHNEDKLLRRIISTNTTYWIGLTKELTKGELKSRFRWEDESDAGTYITRYVILDNEGQEKGKGKDDPPITSCTLKLSNGKMKVECLVGQTQLLAYPICMYRPPALI